MPASAATFRAFPISGRGLDMDEDTVAFIGEAPPVAGVYAYDISSGALAMLADTDTLVPGGNGEKFERYFSGVSTDGHGVALATAPAFLHLPAAA